ncbi:MAG: sensor histidine kinase, partial [Bacteroidales bacterium]|nr:sensor histidine kinase [Bacteroidales bacterium]
MKRKQIILLHIIFWILFAVLPVLSIYFYPYEIPFYYKLRVYASSVQDIINFYLCYIFFKPVLFYTKSWKHLIFLALFLAAYTVFRIYSILGLYIIFDVDMTKIKVPSGVILQEVINTAIFSFFAIFMSMALDWFKTQRQKTELQAQNQASELALLRTQINPHFLFNTLNNIYSLVYQKSDNAPEALMKLSSIMRYMLYDSNSEKVQLAKEIEYLNSYIELQRLRLSNKDFIQFNISGNPDKCNIAPMLLIPFVENAFKHSSKNNYTPGIEINLTLTDCNILFVVKNYYSDLDNMNKDKASGIGLNNIR